MALESVTNIADLDASNPVDSTDPGADLGDHIRNIKGALLEDLPNITGPITATQDELSLLAGQEGGFLLKANSTGGGTADAITADFTPNVTLTDGVTVIVRAQGANTITNPTFSPDGLAAKVIVKNSNEALLIGDIAGASHELMLKYNSSNDNWSLINTSAGATNAYATNANGNPNISDTSFSVDSAVTVNTWESVGPTGSGADNIWTALDDVPTDVDWIEVATYIEATSSGDTANTARNAQVYARDDGSAEAVGNDNTIGVIRAVNGGTGFSWPENVTTRKLAVSSVTFDINWTTTFNSSTTIDLYLTGYGNNP